MEKTRFWVRFKDGRFATDRTDWIEPIDQLVMSRDIAFAWLDLQAPYAVDLEDLQKRFGFHPHAIEDCRRFDQRAKLEAFSDHWFWVFHGASLKQSSDWGGEVDFSEVHAFLVGRWLVTVHQGEVKPLEKFAEQWSTQLPGGRPAMPVSPVLAWAKIMDALIEQHADALSGLSEKLESLDDEIAARLRSGQIAQIHQLKMNLKLMRRLLSPQVEYLRAVVEGRMPVASSPEERLHLRAAKDDVQLLVEKLDLAIEATLSIRESYAIAATLASNRMIGRLTAFSVIFLPITFVTGFFGMNFTQIPYSDFHLLALVIGFIVLAPLVVFFVVRRMQD